MKRTVFIILSCCWAIFMQAQEVVHYGYAPNTMAEADMIVQGQDGNGFLAGLICLDPAIDPVVKRLEGHQIKGVRCYLRTAHKQSRQKRSYIMHTTHPDAESTKKICDFEAGWNEIYFDEPVTIGGEPIYVGMQVYEQRGTPHPFVAYGSASVAGACWINLNNQGWESYSNRGTLLIQAILDDEAADIVNNMVYAQVATTPQTVAPSKRFDAEVYFLNYTGESINSVELQTLGQGDETPYIETVTFDTPLAPHAAFNLPMEVYAGSETGVSQSITLTVSKINDQPSQEARKGISHHYVTVDAFQRTSLVEEFTSQYCTVCPLMIYYLDKAMEEYPQELVYVTHHSGFAPDFFTKPNDESLLYLFGNEGLANPAVMYDRRVFDGKISPIHFANVAETTPYTDAFNYVTPMLAMAEVNVAYELDQEAHTIKPTITGRINSELAAAGVNTYISVYLVEDSIPLSEKFFQYGLDVTVEEGAPADLQSSFRHNGIKRIVFTDSIGNPLTLGSENEYSVTFDAQEIDDEWVLDNCRLVAFVHKINKSDINDNEVLNAGQKFLGQNAAIKDVTSGREDVVFYVTAQNRVCATAPIAGYRIYNMQGQFISAQSSLARGVYIIDYKTLKGERRSYKLHVR